MRITEYSMGIKIVFSGLNILIDLYILGELNYFNEGYSH